MPELSLNDTVKVQDIIRKACYLHIDPLGKDKYPRTPLHRINFKNFNKLVETFNDCVETLADIKAVKKLTEYKMFYDQNTIGNNFMNIFMIKIREQLEEFGKRKPILLKNYNEALEAVKNKKKELKSHPLKNAKDIKEIMKLEKAMIEAKSSLKQLKATNQNIKKDVKLNTGVMKHSSVLHTMVNYKDEKDYKTYSGAAGILLNVHEVITENLLNDDEWKHLHSRKLIKECMNFLTKEFIKNLQKFNEAIATYDVMRQKAIEYKSISIKNESLVILRNSCEIFKKNVKEMVKIQMKKLNTVNFSRTKMENWLKDTQNQMNDLKDKFLSTNNLYNLGNITTLASQFTEVCFSTFMVIDKEELTRYLDNSISQTMYLSSCMTFFTGIISATATITFPPLAIAYITAFTALSLIVLVPGISSSIYDRIGAKKILKTTQNIDKTINKKASAEIENSNQS